MNEQRTGLPCPLAPLRQLSASGVEHGGGAIWPLTNNVFVSAIGSTEEIPLEVSRFGFWFLPESLLTALLSTLRKWPRDGALSSFTASVVFLEQREKNFQVFDLRGLLTFKGSGLLPLSDLLDSSRMLEAPIRLPRVMLLSGKKEPVDSVSKSDDEAVDEVGEQVSIVLNDIDPRLSHTLSSVITTFHRRKPGGQSSSS